MKLFVTGTAGQLGYDVVTEAVKHSHSVIPSDVQIVHYPEWETNNLVYH